MKNLIQVTEAIDQIDNSLRPSYWRCRAIMISLVICAAFVTRIQGQVCDGVCDANNNTSLGSLALHNITTGEGNTAVGAEALLQNTTGLQNTAVGIVALAQNIDGDNNTAVGVAALGV